MANELVNLDVHNVDQWRGVVSKLMETKFYAKLGEVGIFAIISQSKSLGMDPLQALNGGLHYFDGKVGMPSETMCALIRSKGHSISKDARSDNTVCILHGKRKDNGDTWTVSFSMDDARAAGLAKKDNWTKYPQAMLYSRCLSMLARQLFPDVIKNCGYDKDELEEITSDVKPVPVVSTEVEASSIEVEDKAEDKYINAEEQKVILDMLDKFSTRDKVEKTWLLILKAGNCDTLAMFPKTKLESCISWLSRELEKEQKVKPLDKEVAA